MQRPPQQGALNTSHLELARLDPDSKGSRFVRELQQFVIYTPMTQMLRGVIPDPQQREPIGLAGGRLPEAVHEVYRSTAREERGDYFDLLQWVSNCRVAASAEAPVAPSVPTPRRVLELTDRYMAEGRNTLTAYDASEGSLFVLFAMVVGLHPGVAPVVAVDNVDHGLNPRLARALQNIDALIDQIDGEAAADAEIAVVQPCPPPEATADALRRVVEGWLGADLPHRRVVIAVPSMETEAWLLPSLRPGLAFHHCVERFCEIPPHVAERVAWPREGLWTAPELLTQCRAPAPGKSRNREKAA